MYVIELGYDYVDRVLKGPGPISGTYQDEMDRLKTQFQEERGYRLTSIRQFMNWLLDKGFVEVDNWVQL